MKIEEAMKELMNGKKIFRSSCPEKGHLYKPSDDIYESFPLKMLDMMADDWEIKE